MSNMASSREQDRNQEQLFYLPEDVPFMLGERNGLSKAVAILSEGDIVDIQIPKSIDSQFLFRVYKTEKGFRIADRLLGIAKEIDFGLLTKKKVITLGRSAEADFPLTSDNPSEVPFSSKKHCQITLSADGKVVIEDLQTKNGTQVLLETITPDQLKNQKWIAGENQPQRKIEIFRERLKDLFNRWGKVKKEAFTELTIGQDPDFHEKRNDYLQGLAQYEQAYAQAYRSGDRYHDKRFEVRSDGSFYVPDIESVQGWQDLATSLKDITFVPGRDNFVNGIYVITSDDDNQASNIGQLRASIDDRQSYTPRKREYQPSKINPVVKHGMLLKDSPDRYTPAVFGGEFLIKVYRRPWYKGGHFAPLSLEIVDINDASGGLLPRTVDRREKLEAVLRKIESTGIKIHPAAKEKFFQLALNN